MQAPTRKEGSSTCPWPATENPSAPCQVCGLCGNFNDEDEDELMMPSDELAQNDTELVDSWQDRESDPK